MSNPCDELRRRLGEVMDLRSAAAVLHWDQETYMPPKGAAARGQQLATLSALAHRLFTYPAVGDLAREMLARRDELDPGDAILAEVTLYDFQRATRLPESFVEEFALEQSKAFKVWVEAREKSDFALFRPNLEKMTELLRRRAALMGYEGSPYNALIEDYERGATAEEIAPIFAQLAARQSALIQRIAHSGNAPDLSWSQVDWPVDAQWAFSLELLTAMGYDNDAGRQDKSVHPFTIEFDMDDVRVTTRLSPREPFMCFMGTIHEGGHALYAQGIARENRRTPLADGASLGIHESQSRMWENILGRSLPFWRFFAPKLAAHFPDILKEISPEQVCSAVNDVRPSLIRVEADECTYNLHIILRFEIEKALIEGEIEVGDIPSVWNAKMKQYLGVDVPNDAEGCLQDIHWAHGSMGYFPTYALGNLYAAQMFDVMERDIPGIWNGVEQGDFAPVLAWLREHVHRHGRRMTPGELIQSIAGSPMRAEPYLKYLETKYTGLYGL